MNSRIVAAACVLAAGLAASAAAETYYVDMGAEASGDGSQFSPMKTAAGGVFKLSKAGDELIIRRGLYVGSLELRNLRGQRDAPIVIRGEREEVPEGEAELTGFSPSKYAPVIRADKANALIIRNCSYVEIEGLLITGARQPNQPAVLVENSDHVTFRNCDVYDSVGTLIQFKGGRRHTLENCAIFGSVLEHGVQFLAANQIVVRGCAIYLNSASAIHVNASKPTGGDGLSRDVVIENNLIYANGRLPPGASLPRDSRGREIRPTARLRYGAAAIAGDGMENSVIRNNVIHRNHVGAIVLYREEAVRAGQNTRVLHNTIYLPAETGGAYGVYLALMAQGAQVFNNVIVTAGGPALWLGAGSSRDLRSDHNVIFRLDGNPALKREKEDLALDRWQQLYRLDRNSILFRPPFVDADPDEPALADLQLKEESRLAGRAQHVAEVATDLLGRWRPKERVTPGSYELNPLGENPNQPPPRDYRRPTAPATGGPPRPPGPPSSQPPKPAPPPPPPDDGIILPPLD